ncbi:MAG: hypothetical protein ACJ79X_02480 [Gemmatimonadaceae bacterium]
MKRLSDSRKPVSKWLVLYAMIVAIGCRHDMGDDASRGFPREIPSDPVKYRQVLDVYPLSGSPHTRKRKKECLLCHDTIEVTIQARGNTLAIDPKHAPQNVAVPVAHLFHDSAGDKEAYYHMGSQKDGDYDLWVYFSSDKGKARWSLVEMSPSKKLRVVKTDDFNYCDTTYAARVSDADFADQKHNKCSYDVDAAASGTTSSLSATVFFHAVVARLTTLFAVNPRTGGGWIDCNNGCCT